MLGKALAAAAKATQPAYVEDVFQTWLYAGNSSTQTITNGVDLAGKGGLVWIKNRTQGTVAAASHVLHDSARGVTNYLSSNSTNQEFDATTGGVTAFNATGFNLGSLTRYNNSGDNYASWTFRKQAKFFDVVTWTGNDVDGRTVAHNLGSVPGCIIVKRTDTAGTGWAVYHRSLLNTQYLVLNTTAGTATNTTFWSSTTPTSTEFTLGTVSWVNASGGTYVAYLFAHDAGGFGASGSDSVVKCGSFTSDGSGNATVNLGWEPQWLLFKSTSAGTTKSWVILDTMRGGSLSDVTYGLEANSSAAEGGGYGTFGWNPSATGFTFRGSLFFDETYIYIAIRRGPMKTPTDATKVFSAITATDSSGTQRTTNFPIDLQILNNRPANGIAGIYALDRLRGVSTNDTAAGAYLNTTSTAAEATTYAMTRYFDNTGYKDPAFFDTLSMVWWNFRRAPGFFDVVAYTNPSGNAGSETHNLGVKPQMIIVKNRLEGGAWEVYHEALGATNYLRLSTTAASASASTIWNNTEPTSTVFTHGNNGTVASATGGFIAYLFASCLGVSKVGSYTGTGTTLSIDCGFTAGARFVLIKRTDSTGDWYVWDTARGIVSGNDPYLLLNSTAAEVTNTDYIDPLSSGFQISSTAPAAINANGGSFIYLAIA